MDIQAVLSSFGSGGKKELRRRIESLDNTLKDKDKEISKLQYDLADYRKRYQKLMKQYERVMVRWVRTTGDKTQQYLEHLEAACATSWAALGDVAALRNMLSNGASIHKANACGRTALHEASYFGHTECVRFLLESGAEVEIQDRCGVEPLQDAMMKKNVAIASMIETAGSTLEKKKLKSLIMKSDVYLDPFQNCFLFEVQPLHAVAPRVPMIHKWNRRKSENPFSIDKSNDDINPKKRHLEVPSRVRNKSKQNKKLDSSEEKESEIGQEYGIAFGIMRGMCHGNGNYCDCQFYVDSGQGMCTCGHFPATHQNLGPAQDLLEQLKRLKSPNQVLIPKSTLHEWPKVFYHLIF